MVHQLAFCEDSEMWSLFESWFTPFSRCFEWTALCYVPFVYLALASYVWIYMAYFRKRLVRPPKKRLSVWTPLQFTRSALAASLMTVFFISSAFGEVRFYGMLYTEYRGELVTVQADPNIKTRFVPMASILYDVVNWLSCIIVHVLHYLHRDVGRQTSRILTSYWSLMAIFHLPAYYRIWMEIVYPAVQTNLATNSVVLHTVTYPLIIASLTINVVMNKNQTLLNYYENIPGYNRRRSLTR